MGRLFFSLYFFIVLSLVLLTTGLESLVFSTKASLSDVQQGWLNLITSRQNRPDQLKALLKQGNIQFVEQPISNLATSEQISRQLNSGYIISSFDDEVWRLIVPLDSDKVLSIEFKDDAYAGSSWWLYSSLFFVLLAGLIAIWIYPIYRDVSKLIDATKQVNNDGSFDVPTFSPSSPLLGIAQSLKELRFNVSTLVKTQRELTSAITHEFKTPLARLKFALAESQHLDEKKLLAIHQDIDEIDHLVQEMLDYTKLNIQSPELHMECIPLFDLCVSRVDIFRKNTGKRLEVTGEQVDLIADPQLLARALDNLISNAIRYSETTVNVCIETDEKDVKIHVDDDGIGLDSVHYDKIFDPFYAVHHSRTEIDSSQASNSGLGLAIVKRIMQWHHGKCNVSNSILGGARFTLVFQSADSEVL